MEPSNFKRTVVCLFKKLGLRLCSTCKAFNIRFLFHSLPRKSDLHLIPLDEVTHSMDGQPESYRTSAPDQLNGADFTGCERIRVDQAALQKLLFREINSHFFRNPPFNPAFPIFIRLAHREQTCCRLVNNQSTCISSLYSLVEKDLQEWAMGRILDDQLRFDALVGKVVI